MKTDSNEAAPPVPRAERNSLDPEIWQIYGPSGTHCGVTEAKLATMTYDRVWNDGMTVARVEGLILKAKLEETVANGNRVAAELGLPEGSGVDEVIGAICKLKGQKSAYNDQIVRFLEFRATVNQALGLAPGTAEAVLLESLKEKLALSEERRKACNQKDAELQDLAWGICGFSRPGAWASNIQAIRDKVESLKHKGFDNSNGWTHYTKFLDELKEKAGIPREASDKDIIPFIVGLKDPDGWSARDLGIVAKDLKEKLQVATARNIKNLEALDRLAQFIGHPGTTANHVVAETVSLIEKFMTGARLIGVKDAKPCSAAETFVAKMRETEEITVPARLKFAEFLGSLCESWSGLSVEAINWIERLRASDKRTADFLKALREITDAGFSASMGQLLVNVGAWKRRAMTAEAKLAGPPDDVRTLEEIRDSATILGDLVDWRSRALAAEARLAGPPDEQPAGKLIDLVEAVVDLRRYLGVKPGSTDVAAVREALDVMQSRAEEIGGYQQDIRSLRKFHRVVCRMHGIPSSMPPDEAFNTIAEYLDNAEKRRQVTALEALGPK